MNKQIKYDGCSAVIYREKDDKVFVTQRKLDKHFGGGLWETTGGQMEDYDKDCTECITREIKEELGVGVESIEEFRDYSIVNEKGRQLLVKVFFVRLVSEPIPNEPDFENWGWFDKEEIQKLNFVSNCKERINEYFHS